MRTLRSWLPNWGHALRTSITGGATLGATPRASPSWHGLYLAALSESDKGRTVQRIAEAKTALVARARELFHAAGEHQQEQTAIDDALQILHVLEHCMIRVCARR